MVAQPIALESQPMSDTTRQVRLGIAGIGGFAGSIADLVHEAGSDSEPGMRVVASCDPNLAGHPERVRVLQERGVDLSDDYEALLEREDLDAIWLPLPIQLHRPFTERALEAGKAVMVEKPMAGTLQDVDAMIAARDADGLPLTVGFHDLYDPASLALKRRLLRGEMGELRGASVWACWPRDSAYFTRNNWAGRLKVGETWVLDSPLNNALAHYAMLALFLLGPKELVAAEPVRVRAELYRAADIENYDTVALRAELDTGQALQVIFTHSCRDTRHPRVLLHGSERDLLWTHAAFDGPLPPNVEHVHGTPAHQPNMIAQFARLVRGTPDPDVPYATAEMARSHTKLVNAVSQAAQIQNVTEHADRIEREGGAVQFVLPEIEDAIERCGLGRKLLHEDGALEWTRAASEMDLTGYDTFRGPAGRTVGSDVA